MRANERDEHGDERQTTRKVPAYDAAETRRLSERELRGEVGDEPEGDGPTDGQAEEKEPFEVADAGTPETEAVKERVVAQLKTIYDPEIPVNIYELGMVYGIAVDAEGRTKVTMTLTSPNCPVAGSLPGEVEAKVAATEGVDAARVELVWEPPWSPDLMSEAAKLELNMF